jgi:hypothetical protein
MRGGGALVNRVIRTGGIVESPAAIAARLAAAGEMQRRDICSDRYQAERLARLRYEKVHNEFIVRLEAGVIKAAVLDPWSGEIHPVPVKTWRTSAASRYVSKGRGPIRGLEEGPLLITDAGMQEAKSKLATVPSNVTQINAVKQRAATPLRRAGRRSIKTEQVIAEMRKIDREELTHMLHKEMESKFNASAYTCKKARDQVLS